MTCSDDTALKRQSRNLFPARKLRHTPQPHLCAPAGGRTSTAASTGYVAFGSSPLRSWSCRAQVCESPHNSSKLLWKLLHWARPWKQVWVRGTLTTSECLKEDQLKKQKKRIKTVFRRVRCGTGQRVENRPQRILAQLK